MAYKKKAKPRNHARERYIEEVQEKYGITLDKPTEHGPGKRAPLSPNAMDYNRYRDMGLNKYEAYKLATGKDGSRAMIHKREKVYKRFSLSDPEINQLASEVVRNVLKGKAQTKEVLDSKTGEVIKVKERPTFTNRLAAAEMVKSRTEPVVRMNQNLNLNATISPVDLSKYRRAPSEPSPESGDE